LCRFMSDRDKQILNKILHEIDIASNMVHGVSEDDFLGDEKLKRAVCMTLINIGELVNRHQEVPWKDIAGLRDMAAHKYNTLRMEDVYLTATEDLPALSKLITTIIP